MAIALGSSPTGTPKARADRIGGDVVVGRPDAAGRDHIIVARPQRVEGRDDFVLDIGDDPRFPNVDADLGQIFGDIAEVAVLRASREDLVADHQDGGGYSRRFAHRQVALVPRTRRNPPQLSATLAWTPGKVRKAGGILSQCPNWWLVFGAKQGICVRVSGTRGKGTLVATSTTFVLANEKVGRRSGQIRLHGPEDFAAMRKAGALTAEALDLIGPLVKPGVTTASLDRFIFEFARDHDAYPAPLNYRGYRKSICISINHVVCHGIPDEKPLRDGDILNIDVTLIVDGWHGDASRMFVAGEASRRAQRLIDVTYEAMMRGIEAIKPGGTTGDIGYAIQTYAEGERCSVVRDFCGHGLGQAFPRRAEYPACRPKRAKASRFAPACSSPSSR